MCGTFRTFATCGPRWRPADAGVRMTADGQVENGVGMAGGFWAALDNPRMTARIAAFIVWGLAAASAVFWGLRLGGAGPSAPPHATAAPAFAPVQADLRRVLGDDSARAAGMAEPGTAAGRASSSTFDASRLRLLGVVASPSAAGRADLALISLDGKPARTFRHGAVIEGEQMVQRIEARRVTIGPRDGPSAVTLELPALVGVASGGAAEGSAGLRAPRPTGTAPATPSAPNVMSPAQPATSRTSAAGDSGEAGDEETAQPPRRVEPVILRNPHALNR